MTTNTRTALVTGANAGLGKEVARQLALTGRYSRILLACRDRAKGSAAGAELEAVTGKAIFKVVALDLADLASVAAALATMNEPIDDLVMNAGGIGGKTPLAVTRYGVTDTFAANVLGHVALLDGLLKGDELRHAAVYVGSEAARGVPKLGMKRPVLANGSVDELTSFCDGSYFRDKKPDPTVAYGQVKLVAALWMGSVARHYPDLRFITMSPGNTSGTEITRDMSLPMRLLMKHVLQPIVMPLLGVVHSVEKGAARLVEAIDAPDLASGAFYASQPDALTGAVVDQSTIFPEIARLAYQDNASAAVHRFTAA